MKWGEREREEMCQVDLEVDLEGRKDDGRIGGWVGGGGRVEICGQTSQMAVGHAVTCN